MDIHCSNMSTSKKSTQGIYAQVERVPRKVCPMHPLTEGKGFLTDPSSVQQTNISHANANRKVKGTCGALFLRAALAANLLSPARRQKLFILDMFNAMVQPGL